ncbi:phosphopantetheine-binding protein [Tolypothrix tenuis PCC 7101]|uniref:Phosphopantetheine-binding protein n=1 Tax=Tolypothrix tenuis PCC 7101 TaxID=231146 RepID=A0A1Z4N257_9CYAN|nr:acyl carrier protein [Aulosira sp. FACHB-113]BAY99795.1 phosphopantetheine-binding protein [Tolypothrix tenuis PCC 7101]BAZ76283.1 phosphopantetheine-binding protein [Aulosira laxa NIES-50]
MEVTSTITNNSLASQQNNLNAEVIQESIVAYIAELLEVEPQQVNVKASFTQYGLDSLSVVSLISHLESLTGEDLSPTLLYDLPSIEVLSQRLASGTTKLEVPI